MFIQLLIVSRAKFPRRFLFFFTRLLLASSKYQKAGVRYILDSVVKELQKNPERRFVVFAHICSHHMPRKSFFYNFMFANISFLQVHLCRNGLLHAVVYIMSQHFICAA